MNYQAMLDQVQQYLTSFFDSHSDTKFFYHNREHTESVAAAVRQIANHYQLNDKDFFIVMTAAWFHDIGYYENVSNHEETGAQSAEAFLKGTGIDQETIDAIRKCILATKMPQTPKSLFAEIVCDADLFHLGTDEFTERSKLIRKEYEAVNNTKMNKDEWRKKSIELLESHHYFTDYCQLLLNEKKKENLEKLKRKVKDNKEEKTNDKVVALVQEHLEETGENTTTQKEKKKKTDRPERGIETMFRISSGNHQRLSDMADSKAHIMISVNSIIISVLLSVLLRKLKEYPQLQIPAILLLAVSLTTIIFSILATRPTIPGGRFSQNDIAEKKVNLLFFGNFYKMNLEDYTSGMLQMMDDREFLYGSLIRDVYAQGVVLGRKYRMLRASYNVFMYGLVASVIGFIIASLFIPAKVF